MHCMIRRLLRMLMKSFAISIVQEHAIRFLRLLISKTDGEEEGLERNDHHFSEGSSIGGNDVRLNNLLMLGLIFEKGITHRRNNRKQYWLGVGSKCVPNAEISSLPSLTRAMCSRSDNMDKIDRADLTRI